jgi:hypothetical protein
MINHNLFLIIIKTKQNNHSNQGSGSKEINSSSEHKSMLNLSSRLKTLSITLLFTEIKVQK